MNLHAHVNQLKRIHFHIEHKSSGSPAVFAARLGLSKRSLHRILEALRDQDVHILYSRSRGYYLYADGNTIANLLKILGGGKVKIF